MLFAVNLFSGVVQPPEKIVKAYGSTTDYGRLVRKSPSLHGRKSNPNPKFLGTA